MLIIVNVIIGIIGIGIMFFMLIIVNVIIGVIVNQFVFNLCEETISRTDEGQPRPKYIFNECGTNIYFFTLQRFGPSPSPNFKIIVIIARNVLILNNCECINNNNS